jgi:hypothetical protein
MEEILNDLAEAKEMKTMKTPVEWLIDEHFGGIENCTPDFRFHIQQALEMENKFIEDYKIYKKYWEITAKLSIKK